MLYLLAFYGFFKVFFFSDAFQWGKRHTQTLLLFTGLIIAYGLRVNLSVAIVAMTDKSSANKQFIVSLKLHNKGT